jgi:hypothetical protein
MFAGLAEEFHKYADVFIFLCGLCASAAKNFYRRDAEAAED